jgi:hypothetical protein
MTFGVKQRELSIHISASAALKFKILVGPQLIHTHVKALWYPSNSRAINENFSVSPPPGPGHSPRTDGGGKKMEECWDRVRG